MDLCQAPRRAVPQDSDPEFSRNDQAANPDRAGEPHRLDSRCRFSLQAVSNRETAGEARLPLAATLSDPAAKRNPGI